jgi:hypothetical protein
MSVRTDQANLILTINNTQSAKTLKEMEQSARDLRRLLTKIPVDSAEFKEAAAAAAALDAKIKGVKSSMSAARQETTSFQKVLGGFAKAGAAIGAVFAAFSAVGGIINATRETEKLFAVLKNATGGSELKALTIFQQLQEFAATTPFALNEVVGAFTKLQQRNFNPTIEQLRTMGDIAASSGKSIDQFVEAILDAQTGEFERLKEFGVVARKEGDNVRVTFRGQAETFKNTSENLNAYLLKLGELPGISGATAAVAATLDGSLSNLGDNFTRLFATLGSGGGFLKAIVDGFGSLVESANAFFSIPLSTKLREQQTEFNALVGVLKDVNASESTRNQAIAELQRNYPEYIGNINLENASQSELNGLLVSGNQLFEKRIFLQQNEEKLVEFAKERIKLERQLFDAQKEAQILAQSGQAGSRPVRFGANDLVGADRVQPTRGETADARVNAFREALEKLSARQQQFTQEQDQFANSLFGTATAAEAAAAAAKKAADEAEAASKSGGGSPAKKAKEEAEAAAGSLAFLRKQISDVQKEIENTPGQSKALEPLIKQLKIAEAALKSLEDRIERLKNPTGDIAPSAEEIAAQLGTDPSRQTPGATDADRLAILEFNQFVLDEGKLTAEELAAFQLSLSKKKSKDQTDQDLKDEEERSKSIKDTAISSASSVAGALVQIRQNKLQEETDAALSALDTEYAAKRKAAGDNQQALDRLNKQYEAKKAAIEKESAEKRKRIALIEATIAAALAIVKALPDPFTAFAAGVAGAAQVAVIANAKYAGGGYTGPGSNRVARDETGHRPVGVVHANEWVSPPWMTSHPVWGPQVAALEMVRRRGFADGGYTTTPSVSVVPYSAGSNSTAAADQSFMMLATEFRNFRQEVSGWQSKLRVSYLDIESVGSDLSAVRTDAGF